MTREELRQKIIDKIKDKRPDDSDRAEEVADFIIGLPYIHEDTYETFMKNAGLL